MDETKELDVDDWPSDSGSGDWPSDSQENGVNDMENPDANEDTADNAITDWRIIAENKYYNAELTRRDAPESALKEFLDCIAYEEEQTAAIGSDEIVKRFDALTHCVLLQCQFSMRDGMISSYQKLLGIANKVTPYDLNKSIRKILDFMENNNNNNNFDMESEVYSMTLDYFSQQQGKEHVWFTFAMRLCKQHLKRQNIIECSKILNELHSSCQKQDGTDDSSKGGNLLQIYAIKIQIMTLRKNKIGLNELFDKTSKLVADVDDDESISVIYECWAKMYASMNDWKKSINYFFDAFRAYSRIGDLRAKQCLKYVIISTMLSPNAKETVNPFATQEAKAYQTNKEIISINNLLNSFENNDIREFEIQLNIIMNESINKNDLFINLYIPYVKLRLQSNVLIHLVQPYQRVKLEWLSKQLGASLNDIETLVINLIKDGSINGKLDQINMLLELNSSSNNMNSIGNNGNEFCNAVNGWMSAVKRLQTSLGNKSQGIENKQAGQHGLFGIGHGIGMFDYDDLDFASFGQFYSDSFGF